MARLAQQMTRVANSVGIQKAPATDRTHAVRDPHRGLDDREGSQGRRGPGADRPGHLQPAVRRTRRCRSTPRCTTSRTANALQHPAGAGHALQHVSPPRPAADAHHQPEQEVDRGGAQPGAQPGPGELPRRSGRASGCSTCWPTPKGATPSPPPTTTTRGTSTRRGRQVCWGDLATRPVGEPRVAGIIGSPVRHSLSPVMHNAAFAACGLDGCTSPSRSPAGAAAAALGAVRPSGPARAVGHHAPQDRAWPDLVDERSPAVEALRRRTPWSFAPTRTSAGESTDGDGFVDSLRLTTASSPPDCAVVVLGAGGAARSVVLALAEAGCREVVVVNRTVETAAGGGRAGGGLGAACGGPADVRRADLVVHATPRGMGVPVTWRSIPRCSGDGQVVADLVYHPLTDRRSLEAAAGAGLRHGRRARACSCTRALASSPCGPAWRPRAP